MKIFKIFIKPYFLLALIITLAFVVRLYKIDSPIADWHSWRQTDTAAVTRNFIKMGFNPFIPRYDDMSGVSETPIVNPLRFRFVEFPIYNMAVYPLYFWFGVNEIYHRLISVIFSLGSIVFLYLITKKYTNSLTGLIASFVFAFLPYNVFFSRTTLPEPTFVFFSLGMIYLLDKWIFQGKGIWALLGFLFTSVAFLMKPWAIFFFLPLIYLLYLKKNSTVTKKFIIFTLLALTPFILWRLWILRQPEGIPASSWLLNGDGIRMRPAFWWWIISERLGREILGVTGLFLFLIGLITSPKNKNYFLHFWALSIFLYFLIFATGNVRHDYYQIIFVPIGSIFLALGFIQLIKGSSINVPRIWTIILALLFFPLVFYFSFLQTKGLYQINNPAIVEAGKKADQILPRDAIVVAPYNGDSAFLYQTNRPGWPVVALPLTSLIADYGVTHYISTAKDDKTNWVMRHFEVLANNPNFVIADLTKITLDLDSKLDPEPH